MGAGIWIDKIGFHVEHLDHRGQKRTFTFALFGKNKSNIQNERDPARRALAYDLLEAWGVLERLGDLTLPERVEKLPKIAALFDLVDATVSGRLLEDMDVDIADFQRLGFLSRIGSSDVLLFEDDLLGEALHKVEGSPEESNATVTLTGGGSGERISREDVSQFEIGFGYLRDVLRDILRPLSEAGRGRPGTTARQ